MNKLFTVAQSAILTVLLGVSALFTLIGGFSLLIYFMDCETVFQQLYVQMCIQSALLCLLLALIAFCAVLLLSQMGFAKDAIEAVKKGSNPFQQQSSPPPPPNTM